jgi:hypothetical protein
MRENRYEQPRRRGAHLGRSHWNLHMPFGCRTPFDDGRESHLRYAWGGAVRIT